MHHKSKAILLLFVLLVLALAEKEVTSCSKQEAEMNVAHEECTKATSLELVAKRTREQAETEYNKANEQYDMAFGRWQVALKEENKAKTAHHNDVAILQSITKTEHELCEKLVRNVDEGTPCAELLEQARAKNRLFLCREAKKNLVVIQTREQTSRSTYEISHKALMTTSAAQIALRKVRDETFERLKVANAVWTMRDSTQTATCTRFNELKLRFHGPPSRECKKANECVSFQVQCAEQSTKRVCVSSTVKSTCVSQLNGACTEYSSTTECNQWNTVQHCARNKLICTSRQEKEICSRVFVKPRISGPATCPENLQQAFRKEGKTLIRSCKPREEDARSEIACQSTYDPTLFTFKSDIYDMTSEGDYELYASTDGSVEVHNRQTMLPTSAVTVNSKVAVLANGVDLVTYDCQSKVFTLNGETTTQAQQQFANGGSYKFDDSLVEVFAANGDRIWARISSEQDACYINTYVFSKNTQGSGLCYAESKDADKYRISGLFRHFELPHDSRRAIAGAQERILETEPVAMRQAAHAACNLPHLAQRLKKQCQQDWLLANDNFRSSVIKGYKQMINDELRGRFEKRNFF